jgi:hypothetical protein
MIFDQLNESFQFGVGFGLGNDEVGELFEGFVDDRKVTIDGVKSRSLVAVVVVTHQIITSY